LNRPKVEDLISSLGSTSTDVRQSAVYKLKDVEDKAQAVTLLVDQLADDNPETRLLVVQSLCDLGQVEAVPALVRRCNEEEDELVLQNLVQTLAHLGDERALPAIIEATRHPNGFVRQDAARSLGKLGDRRGEEALTALLGDRCRPESRDEWGGGSMATESVGFTARRALKMLR
jgi:HEAT repeat protein